MDGKNRYVDDGVIRIVLHALTLLEHANDLVAP